MVGARGAARPAAPVAALPSLLVRRLLVALAALALLGSGGATALPRSADAVASVAATSMVAPPAARTAMSAPDSGLVLRGVALAGVPGPSLSGAALPPGSRPLVAPHLVAQPQTRPPSADLAGTAVGAPGSRAPPVAAGT